MRFLEFYECYFSEASEAQIKKKKKSSSLEINDLNLVIGGKLLEIIFSIARRHNSTLTCLFHIHIVAVSLIPSVQQGRNWAVSKNFCFFLLSALFVFPTFVKLMTKNIRLRNSMSHFLLKVTSFSAKWRLTYVDLRLHANYIAYIQKPSHVIESFFFILNETIKKKKTFFFSSLFPAISKCLFIRNSSKSYFC